jgi:putative tryptophan/tyrosine transport system substrate-binding protein
MRRREFIALIAAALPALTRRAVSQPAAVPTIGYLSASSAGETTRLTAFARGLAETGFSVGRDALIEFRYAEGRYERLPELVQELLGRKVAVILASALPAAQAAKAAKTATPVVFVSGADPVQMGLVQSLNRPGGNLTGISNHFGALGGKRLELLRELVKGDRPIGYLFNPDNQNAIAHSTEVTEAARGIAQPLVVAHARTAREIETAFAEFKRRGVAALLVGDDPFYNTERTLLISLAARDRIPAIYYASNFVLAGGLISYGSDQTETYRLGGVYVARILKGEKPQDLPVALPTKFELVINLRTAKTLGLDISPTLLARTDEVIE